jgi:transcriptional regulator with XRE-family HTH domain
MKFDDDLDMRAIAIALGERIRAFRETHGLSQRDVAERTGIPREQINRFEKGAMPSLKNLIILARFMDITLHELLFGTPDEQVVIPNRLIRNRVLRIERMGFEAQRWLIDLMDGFIFKATSEEEDELRGLRGER